MLKLSRLKILLSLVASLTSLGLGAAAPQSPRLLVGIMVEGLDGDCLELLREQFGNGGFRRLERNGLTIAHADYGTYLDAAAAAAELMTGAAPAVNGIPAEYIYDRDGNRIVSVYADAATMGNYTNASYSPAALKVSTLSDEVRIGSGGVNVVYAVAPDPAVSLALAGHAGNSALWLDAKTGNWASSTYYKELPVAVAARNRMAPLSVRLDTMSWTPSIAPGDFPLLPDHLTRYPFRHVFPRGKSERLDMFAASPLVNAEVTDVAIDLLASLRVGQHEGVTDVLNVAYTLEPYTYGKNPDNRPEIYDAYVKLDRRLEQLFNTIDSRVGLDSTVVFLAATPRRPGSRRDEERWNIPYGEFSTRKAASLLNIYLMAIYGNGDYVAGFHRGQFFLNQKHIKDRGLDIRAVRAEAADFLSKMTGVDRVYTIDDIIAGRAGEKSEILRRNTVRESAGDLVIEVVPGFETIDDLTDPMAGGGNDVYRIASTTAPAFIMAPGMTARTIGTPVDVRAIAPTVASILRIRSPNGAAVPPVKAGN